MADSVYGVVEAYKSLWNYEKSSRMDIDVMPLKFDTDTFESEKKLKIGYCSSDSEYTVSHPGNRRAIAEAKTLLERCGHTVVEYQLPSDERIMEFYYNILLADDFS